MFQVCDQFYFCVDGVANKITCPESLIFNPKTVSDTYYFVEGCPSDFCVYIFSAKWRHTSTIFSNNLVEKLLN